MRDKATHDAPMLTHAETLADAIPASAAILLSERCGDFHDHATGTFSLARVDGEESPPRRVTDTFGEVMILHQAFDVEVFKDRPVTLYCG